MSGKKGIEFIRAISEHLINSNGFSRVFKNINLISACDGTCKAEFTVGEEHLNGAGGLHGGFTATVVDNYTTYALLTTDKPGGVSVDLHVSYMKGAKEGDVVVIDAKTIRAGQKIAYLECDLLNKKDGSIIARGTQTKFIGTSDKSK